MSEEKQTTASSDAYAGFLDNFGTEIGDTLEDLASHWTETEYEFAEDVRDQENRNTQTGASRGSSFQSCGSMDSTDGLADWSLKKARPLAFANPVYDLISNGRVVTKSRQMNLIPLSQFDINKPHDDSGKHKKKQQKGLMKKLSNLTVRKHHSMKKQDSEMEVTAPLWTDAPGVYADDIKPRSVSLNHSLQSREKETEEEEEEQQQQQQERELRVTDRPRSLIIDDENSSESIKVPPAKTPRTSKGNLSPVEKPPNEFVQTEPQKDSDQVKDSLELPKENKLRPAGSSTSLGSDLSEDMLDEEQSKTMMEVMHEIEDDPTDPEQDAAPQQVTEEEEELGDDAPLLKRNKTLKWSGSRAAPALIREFTKKSKKLKQVENVMSNSPDVSAGESPAKMEGNESALSLVETDDSAKKNRKQSPALVKKRDSSAFTVLSSLLPPAPKLRRSESTKIRTYIHKMGTNPQNALGYATTEFVKQTINSTEHRPIVLLHSIRSFMTDIKKYLVSNPHLGFMAKIQKTLKHLPLNDVEGAIDDALERLVLYPLRDCIYKILVLDYARSGKIQMVEDSIKVARVKSAQELGIRATLIPPNEEAMETVKRHFTELQTTYSPYYKLKSLLSAVTTIYENTTDLTCEDQSARKIGADDFLPMLVLAIVKCDFAAADIEAQYIDGLLDPALLLGEGGYYLTTLISAVQVLSTMKKREAPLPNITDLQGFLKVGISAKTERMLESENNESYLMHKTLHVPPSMTALNLGMMIAKKYGIRNTKSFCLHVVVNGVAYPLKPQEFPQLVKMDLLTQFAPGTFFFVYRQVEKSPEKSKGRPETMNSERLKVNTENGDELELSADVERMQRQNTESSEGTSEDSDGSLKRKETTVSSLDATSPMDDSAEEELHSSGFAVIPLPDSVVLNKSATDTGSGATVTTETIMPFPEPLPPMPSPSNEIPPDAMALPPDAMPLPPDATSSRDAMPLPPDVVPSPLDALPSPPDAMALPPDAMALPPDAMPPSPDAMALPPGAVSPPTDITMTTDSESAPHSGTPPPPNAQFDSATTNVDDVVPSTDAVTAESTSSPKHFSNDSSDLETTSEDEAMIDESYLRAMVVDDVLSPIKKRKPPRTANQLEKQRSLPVLEEVNHSALKDGTGSGEGAGGAGKPTEVALELLPPLEEAPQITIELPEDEGASLEPPQVTAGVSQTQPPSRSTAPPNVTKEDSEPRSDSVLSDVSIGSVGCHSDGYHGDSMPRHGSKGYHSDGHLSDDPVKKDIGALTSVSSLKCYFEDEIHKVSQKATKNISPK